MDVWRKSTDSNYSTAYIHVYAVRANKIEGMHAFNSYLQVGIAKPA